jgi:hypothetical protein
VSGDGNAECALHKGPGRGNFIFFSPPLDSSPLEAGRQHSGRGGELGGGGRTRRKREGDLEERSGLEGDVDSGERGTLGGHGSDVHLTKVQLEGTGSARGRYDCENPTQRIQRSSGLDRH